MPKATRRRPRPHRAEPLEPRRLLATVSGVVYNDNNADGNHTPFVDLGLAGWTVYVDANENGSFDAGELNATSAASGAWSITSVGFRPRTNYAVRAAPQPGWRPTEPAAGDYSVSFASTSDTVPGLDFGQTRRALVTGTVFHDTNDDSTWDREPVLSGRNVFADANDNGILDAGESNAVTNANGDYALSPAAGAYTIRQVQQPGWWQTFPTPPSAGHPRTVAAGQIIGGGNFGNVVATVDLLGAGFGITSAFDPVPADGRIDVLYQIRNNGTADSPGFRAKFYLSQDANITAADTLLRDIAQGSIPRHGTADRTTVLTLPTPDPFRNDNQYYVGMIVDPDADVPETDETNNSNRGVLADRYPVSSEGNLPRPVDNANVIATTVAMDGSVNAALGDEWVGDIDQDVYRFEAVAGHRVSVSVSGLGFQSRLRIYNAAWEQMPRFTELTTVPATGTYYAVVSAGDNDQNDPRRLSGRVAGPTGPYTIRVTDYSPDYTPGMFIISTFPIPTRVQFAVENMGSPASPFDVGVYLSDDPLIETSDTPLGVRTVVPQDFQGDRYMVFFDIALPAADPFRSDNQYWIGMIIDPANAIAELDETNNRNTPSSRASFRSEEHLPSPVDGGVRVTQSFNANSTTPQLSLGGNEWIGPYDMDTFQYRARAGERVGFDVDRVSGTINGYLRLYDASWTLLAQNDDAGAPGEPGNGGGQPYIDYTFTAAGDYYLVISGAGNHTGDPRQVTGRSAAAEGVYTITATSFPAGPVTGALFDDANANGLRDDGEAGLVDRRVYLDTDDSFAWSAGEPFANSDATGEFVIPETRAGSYVLRWIVPTGRVQTTPPEGGIPLTIASGQAVGPLLLGAVREGVVTGTVYEDADSDGQRDEGEPGLPGWAVYADLNRNGTRDLATVTINATGLPDLGNVVASTIVVAGYPLSRIADVDVLVNAGLSQGTLDLYLSRVGGGTVVLDQGRTLSIDGLFDDEAGSPGLPPLPRRERPDETLSEFDGTFPGGPWTLTAHFTGPFISFGGLGAFSLVLTLSEPFTRTDAAGNYSLAGLLPGEYDLRADAGDPIDWVPTSPAGGVHPVALAPGQTVSGREFSTHLRRTQVTGHHVFYNNSAFDGRDPAPNAADDDAIAPGKSAGAPGASAAFANVTSYDKGINGVMIDIRELRGPLSPADFTFKVQSVINPSVWVDAPAPTGFAVRDIPGPDHDRRVTFTWPDHLIRNAWLQVGVAANPVTRLAAPVLAYFGNLVGDTGGGNTRFAVDAADLIATRGGASASRATVDNPHDHNRDGYVNIRDQILVRTNLDRTLSRLTFSPPTSAAFPTFMTRRATPLRAIYLVTAPPHAGS